MPKRVSSVLFVSKSDTARSLLARACLNHLGKDKFRAFSCGHPEFVAQEPSPWALLALNTAGISSADLHPRSWHEFLRSGAVKMDFIITLDATILEAEPHWPGQPASALWDYPPLPAGSTAIGMAALQLLHSLRRRLELFVELHSKISSKSDLLHDLRDLAHF